MSSLDSVFHALADPNRRAMLAHLAKGEATLAELQGPLEISQPSVSRHLKVLESAGLVSTRIDGTARPRRIEPKPFVVITDWLDEYRKVWGKNFERLDKYLDQLQQKDQT